MLNYDKHEHGFVAAMMDTPSVPEFMRGFEQSGAQTYFHEPSNTFLAAWPEEGRGLYTSDGVCLAYDLDLSNETELKSQLSGNGQITPAELIVQLYKKDGLNFLDNLRGAFSFVLFDSNRKALIAATDAFGIHPVVYYNKGNDFIISSRICHVTKIFPDQEISPEAIFNYLFFQAICTPLTIYKDIRKLEPGNAIEAGGRDFNRFEYYDIRYSPDYSKNEDVWIRTIPEELSRAVGKYSLLSDPAKTGCFLSGGTDSSSLAGYYTGHIKSPAKTFSIGFDDPRYNELGYVKIAADHYGLDRHEYVVKPEDVLALLDHLPEIYDEPFGNASVIAAYYCAMIAKQKGVDVLLGGDGGDEIFGGNERYVKDLVFQRYEQIPEFVRKGLIEPLVALLPAYGPAFKAKRYIRRANIPNPDRFFSYNLLAETSLDKIFQEDFLRSLDSDYFLKQARLLYGKASPAKETDRLLYIDMKYTITDNDLRKVSQMTEAAGVRSRYPYLDRDLVDFTATIPPELKVKPGRNRYIFKQAMKGFLPDEIINKSKHGMGLPVSKWLREDRELNSYLRDTFSSDKFKTNSYIKLEFVDSLINNLLTNGNSYYGDNLWVFLTLTQWLAK